MPSRKAQLTILAVVVTVVLATCGVAAVAVGSSFRAEAADLDVETMSATWETGTNANGQTYGSMLSGEDGSAPDLISVEATNGKSGYCLGSELNDPYEGLGKDATADEVTKAGLRGRTIPVYESDGTTQIGVFVCGGPGSGAVYGYPDGSTVSMTAREDGTIVTTTRDAAGTITAQTLEALDGTITVVQ